MRFRNRTNRGFTLIELLLVVAILSMLSSLLVPRVQMLITRAYQAKTKANLTTIRSAIQIYYAENEGSYPLASYPPGNTFYADNISLTSVLVPKYLPTLAPPKINDQMDTYNGLAGNFDSDSENAMAQNPPHDIFIVWGIPDYTPMLSSPYAYDNQNGTLYIPNGNYDVDGQFVYTW